jgi:hypothetical protein
MEETAKPMFDLLNLPLYKSIELTEIIPEQLIQILLFHEMEIDNYSISSIDCYCTQCQKPTTFKSQNSQNDIIEKVYIKYKGSDFFDTASSSWKFDSDAFFPILYDIEFFIRSFYCPRSPNDKSHDISFVFRVNEQKITKIGQFPSRASIENSQLKKYRKLDDEIYSELNRATGLYSSGIGVGSFVYLRRIIEKYIVYPEIEKLLYDEVITKEQVTTTDFKGKVVLAKDHLPSVLVENPRIYSILSKGIHSLSEKECLEIFDPLLTAIELILDERLEKVARENKIERLKNNLNKISN